MHDFEYKYYSVLFYLLLFRCCKFRRLELDGAFSR